MALLQQRKIIAVFGAAANPWEVQVAHGLEAPNGDAITPNKVDVQSVEVEFAGSTVGFPASSCVVTAIDDTNITLQLPAAVQFPGEIPAVARVWVHVERVHTYVGYYDANQQPTPRFPAGAGGGGALDPAPGPVFYVDQAVGQPGNPGTRKNPVDTIIAAQALGIGLGVAFTVEVDAGTYDEAIVWIPGMTLRGSSENVTLRTVAGAPTILRPPGGGSGLIENIRILNQAGGFAAISDQDGGGDHLEIRNCMIAGDLGLGAVGINAQGANVRCFNCEIEGDVHHGGDGLFLIHCQIAGDSAFPLVQDAGSNLMMQDCSVIATNAAPGAHAVAFDGSPSGTIMRSLLISTGGSGLDLVNGADVRASLNLLDGPATITCDGASTIGLGMNQYDPALAVLAGTTNLEQVMDDFSVANLNAASWAAPAPPVSLLTALDRMAAQVAALGVPIP